MIKIISLIMVLMMLITSLPCVSLAQSGTMTVVNMQTDHMTSPIGIDSEKPLFSWTLKDDTTRGQKQTAYRICVADSSENLNKGNFVWDSGKVSSDETLDIEYSGDSLKPSTRYFWNVTVWDKNSVTTISSEAYFETGLMDSGWSGAQWIGKTEAKHDGYYDISDFTLEFDFKIVANAASIVFGASDESNLYMWQVSNNSALGGGTYFRPHSCINGKYKTLVNTTLSADSTYASDYLHMSINVQAGNITTKIGDSVIDTRNVGTFSLGYIGIRKPADEKSMIDSIVVKDGKGNIIYSENFDDGTADGFSSLTVTDNCLDLTNSSTLGTKGVVLHYGDIIAESAPMLRRDFSTNTGKTVASAKLYATAAGIYEIFINGKKTTDSYFNPGRTTYDHTLIYQTFDVTNLINSGKNAIGAYLGHGWFDRALCDYGSELYLYAKLLITYTDGSTDVIVTDNNWQFYRHGPILDDDLFNGYKYDGTIEAQLDGWAEPGYDDSTWEYVKVVTIDKIINNGKVPEIIAQSAPLIRNAITLDAIDMTEPEDGVYIYDFGQNIAGIARIKATAPPSTKMTLRHGEILNRENMQGGTGKEGTLYTGNLPRAEATDSYVFRGDKQEEIFEPSMTYHGFRYLEITGLDAPLPLENVQALLLMTDMEETGAFESSNDMVNRLYQNTLWSARDNFMSIPTDCPQRGERAGWTGDAQIFARTGSYMMDMNAFYQKYCGDMRDSAKDNRIVTDVAPSLTAGKAQYGKPAQNRLEATNGWGDAIVIIPYQIYKQYGNKKILEENYELMCNWMDYLVDTSTDYVRDQSWTGDWLSINETKTPVAVTDTAFCAYSASLVAEIAQILGKTDDAAAYGELYNNYRNAWRTNFLAEDKCTTLCNTQTSYVLGLEFGLFDEAEKKGAAENLVKNIKSWDWHLTTGFLGLSYLNPVLSDNGYADVAYKLLEQEEYPSWLYSVTTGSTTIWESWDALRVFADGSSKVKGESFNHFSYGAVSEWLYRYVLGIERDDVTSNSFKHFILKPQFGGSLTYAKGSYESPRGYISSDWKLDKETGAFEYKVSVPANTTATMYLPVVNGYTKVYESGADVANSEGVKYVEYADGCNIYTLESGSYTFATTADADMNTSTSAKIINKQNVDAVLTVDGNTYTQFPAEIISDSKTININMVSLDEEYTFRNFEDADGNVIADGSDVSGDADLNAVFSYCGADDGQDGKKTIKISGNSDIRISVNGTESTLPYQGEFDKCADVEIKIADVPVGYEFSGIGDIACLSDRAYIMPKCDMELTVNLSVERYKKGYDIFYDFEDSLEGWDAEAGKAELKHKTDNMHVISVPRASDGRHFPRIYCNLYGDANNATGGQYIESKKFDAIEIAFRAGKISANYRPCMYISTQDAPIYTEPVRILKATADVTTAMADGNLHTITFDVGSWDKWSGNIKDIYVDISVDSSIDMMIDYIRIRYKTPTLTIVNTANNQEKDYTYRPGTVVDLRQFEVYDGFLGYSVGVPSEEYISALKVTEDVKVYANYRQIDDIVWDFDDSTAMGWEGINTHSVDTSDASYKMYYFGRSSKADVMMRLENQQIQAVDYRYIVFKMRHNIPESGKGSKPLEVFFKRTTDAKWNQSLSINTTQLPASDGYKTYVLDLSSCSGWSGTVTSLRIDPFETYPSADKGYWVDIDSIRLCNNIPEQNIIYNLTTYDDFKSSWASGAHSSANGADGYEDTAVTGVSNAVSADNLFFYKSWDVTKFSDDKYVVFQADVKFGSNGTNYFVGTNGHQRISPTIDKTNPGIKQDGWNTITAVVEADSGETKMYINGLYECSGKSAMTRSNYNASFNQLRFISYKADLNNTTDAVVSFDNILVYTTDSYPDDVYDEMIDAEYGDATGIKYTAHTDSGILIVASYAGDTLLDAQYIHLTGNKKSIRMNTLGAEYYVAYVWEDMENLIPICNSKTYTVK